MLCIILASAFTLNAQTVNANQPDRDAIVAAMQKSAQDWNRGDLDAFMAFYDKDATFMMPAGPVGLAGMKANYQKVFFNGTMPKQNLSFTEMDVRMLGTDYALLTGKFTLSGNGLPDRSGRYSLTMVRRKEGWRILHDHSS
jgi:uncharacterized protein (TIGR02246 family)